MIRIHQVENRVRKRIAKGGHTEILPVLDQPSRTAATFEDNRERSGHESDDHEVRSEFSDRLQKFVNHVRRWVFGERSDHPRCGKGQKSTKPVTGNCRI